MRRLDGDLGRSSKGRRWAGVLGLVGVLAWIGIAGAAWAQDVEEADLQPRPGLEDSGEITAETDLGAEEEALDDTLGADEVPVHRKVEEILVTGRRREEALQEVPVSIRAFDSAELDARQITRIDEIGFGTANLTFDTANGSNRDARIYIRGIGQDDPRTIVDPAIGIYVDEVYIPRAINALFDVVDFERVEVLRGPQGTLYGKNTIGGVINIVTRKPGHEVGGYLDLNVGSFSLLEFSGAVDLPVRLGWFDDKLFTRWMVATGTEDGYTTNLVDGEHAGDNKLLSVRGSARLFAREDLVFDLVLDWAEQNERSVIGKCSLENPFNIARYATDNFSGTTNTLDDDGTRFTDYCLESPDSGPHAGWAKPLRKTGTDTLGLSFITSYEPLDWLRVKSITGFRQRWDSTTGADLDGTPVDYIGSEWGSQTHLSVSEDLNLTFSFWEDRVNWIVGGFIFYEEGNEDDTSAILREMTLSQDLEFEQEIYSTVDPDLAANPSQLGNSVRVVQSATGLPEFIQQCAGIANVPAGSNIDCTPLNLLLVGAGRPPNPNLGVLTGTPAEQVQGDVFFRNAIKWGLGELNRYRQQKWSNTSFAAYTHLDIEVVDDVIVQGGVRYTNERKEREGVDQRVFSSAIPDLTPGGDPLDLIAALPLVITPPSGLPGSGDQRIVFPQTFDCGQFTLELSDGTSVPYSVDCDRWTPEAGIKWQITDDHMTYFRYAQGWKSGGLRLEALTELTNNSPEFVRPYLPESVNTYEIGVRTSWLDDQLLLNGTLFYNDYENMQVTSLEPNDVGLVTARINNAESAVTRGFEVEGVYLPEWAEKIPVEGSNILFNFGIGFTDAYYEKFIGRTVPTNFDTMGCTDLVRNACAQDPTNFHVDTFAVNTILVPVGLVPNPDPVPVDLSANQFKNTPRLNTNAAFAYSFDPTTESTLTFRIDWSYRSTVYYTTVNSFNLKSDPLHLLNLNLTFDVHSTDTQISFWVKNLTDEVFLGGALDLGEALGASALYYSKPRTLGVRVVQRF